MIGLNQLFAPIEHDPGVVLIGALLTLPAIWYLRETGFSFTKTNWQNAGPLLSEQKNFAPADVTTGADKRIRLMPKTLRRLTIQVIPVRHLFRLITERKINRTEERKITQQKERNEII